MCTCRFKGLVGPVSVSQGRRTPHVANPIRKKESAGVGCALVAVLAVGLCAAAYGEAGSIVGWGSHVGVAQEDLTDLPAVAAGGGSPVITGRNVGQESRMSRGDANTRKINGTLAEGISGRFTRGRVIIVEPPRSHDPDSTPPPRVMSNPIIIVSSDPPDCAIDARQPSEPDGTSPGGWDSMTVTFGDEPPSDPCTLTPDDFSVRVVPVGGVPPFVASVSCPTPDSARVTLNKRIPLSRWTCITYLPTGEEFCMGHQPADVNGDRTSAPADIIRLIDCLHGMATCSIHSCDIDRSGLCAAADILRLIDLLNGCGEFDPWCNDRIDACP